MSRILHSFSMIVAFINRFHAAYFHAFAALDAPLGGDPRESVPILRDRPDGTCRQHRATVALRTAGLVYRKGHRRYLRSKTSSIAFLKSALLIAPCAICGCPSVGMNSSEGIERMPNAAASSCSFSVFTL